MKTKIGAPNSMNFSIVREFGIFQIILTSSTVVTTSEFLATNFPLHNTTEGQKEANQTLDKETEKANICLIHFYKRA